MSRRVFYYKIDCQNLNEIYVWTVVKIYLLVNECNSFSVMCNLYLIMCKIKDMLHKFEEELHLLKNRYFQILLNNE